MYTIEVEVWGEWQADRQFRSLESAKAFAASRFSSNGWRIKQDGVVIFLFDPLQSYASQAREDVEREARRMRWVERFAESRERRMARVNEERRQRIASEAARRRQWEEEIMRNVDWLREGF